MTCLEAGHALAHGAVGIALQCAGEQLALVAVGVVQAGATDAHRRRQVADRSRLVPTGPEAIDREVDRPVFVEGLHSRHASSQARFWNDCYRIRVLLASFWPRIEYHLERSI